MLGEQLSTISLHSVTGRAKSVAYCQLCTNADLRSAAEIAQLHFFYRQCETNSELTGSLETLSVQLLESAQHYSGSTVVAKVMSMPAVCLGQDMISDMILFVLPA